MGNAVGREVSNIPPEAPLNREMESYLEDVNREVESHENFVTAVTDSGHPKNQST